MPQAKTSRLTQIDVKALRALRMKQGNLSALKIRRLATFGLIRIAVTPKGHEILKKNP